MSEPGRTPGAGFEAFDAVYQREFDYVYRTLGRLGVPHGDVADGVHEVFVVLHRRWNEIDPDRPLRPWLFGVARRVAAQARRKYREIPDERAGDELAAPAEDERVAQRDLLWRALARLDEDRGAVLVLHDLEGHTGAEIAEMLALPVNTVHSRLRLARADLVAALDRLERDRGGRR